MWILQTLYTLRSRVEPVKGNDFLRAGSLCHMTLTVTDEIEPTSSTPLMYEVLTDQTMWAVCGRTAGIRHSSPCNTKSSISLIWSRCRCILYGRYSETYRYSRCYASDLRLSTFTCCATLKIHPSRSEIERSLSEFIFLSPFTKVWLCFAHLDGSRKADVSGYSGANLLPRLEPFSPGQVFNWSKAQQVHVLATSTNNGVSSTDNSLSWFRPITYSLMTSPLVFS